MFVLILFLNTCMFAGAVYVPCESSIVANNNILSNKIKVNTQSIKSKSDSLKNLYDDYEKRLELYNNRLSSFKFLQDEKNSLLLESSSLLVGIKEILNKKEIK